MHDGVMSAGLRAPQHVAPQVALGVLAGAAASGAAIALGATHALLVAIALVGIATVVTLLVWPELALSVAVGLIWADVPVLAVDAGAPIVAGAAFPLILLAPLATGFLRGKMLTIDRTFVCMLALLGVFVAATAISSKPLIGADRTLTLVTEGVVLYFLVFNVVRTPEALRGAVLAMLAATVFLAAVTVFQHVTVTFDRPYFGFSPLDVAYFAGKAETPRAYGPVADPNYYAQILVVAIAVALPLLLRERSRLMRLLVGAGVALMTLALAFTYSRGGTLALLVVIGAFVLMGYMRLRYLAAAMLVVVALINVVPSYQDRISTLTQLGGVTAETGSSDQADDAARGRLTENLTAVLVFFDYPLLGTGPGTFGSHYQQYAPRTGGAVYHSTRRGSTGTAPGAAPERAAHNLFLAAAAETGIFGVVALGAVLWMAYSQLARARRMLADPEHTVEPLMAGLLLALIGYVAAGMFLSLAFERYLWLLLALMGAAAFIARNRSPHGADRGSSGAG